ncbi:hypothetical protein NN561_005698 [Cricetulus griseus]
MRAVSLPGRAAVGIFSGRWRGRLAPERKSADRQMETRGDGEARARSVLPKTRFARTAPGCLPQGSEGQQNGVEPIRSRRGRGN